MNRLNGSWIRQYLWRSTVHATLCALLTGAGFSFSGMTHAGTQGPSTSTEIVRMRIAGQMFCIPRNYFSALDEKPDGVIDHNGANLHAKFPEMEGMTEGTRKLFRSTPGTKPVLNILLNEDLRGSHRSYVKRQRDWVATQTPEETIGMMRRFPFPHSQGLDPKRHELVLLGQGDSAEVLTCARKGAYPSPNCSIMKPYPEKLYYKVTFFREYLTQAEDVRERTERLLQSFQSNCR